MRFGLSFARWRTAWLDAVARFPFVLLCGAVGSGCAIAAIHAHRNEALLGTAQRLGMTVALGLPLFFSLRLLRERTTRLARVPLAWVGVALLVGWYFLQPAEPMKAPEIYFIRWLLLLAALHFFAAVAGYVRGGESLGFWQFNRHLFLRFALATLYSGVLTVGFELALLSASQLFELKLDRAYADLFFLMAGCFHPAFFLASVPRDFAELNRAADYPRGLKAFTQFALAPLVAVYTAILFAYAFKIILARSWPHGWVALPVLILSGVGIFAAVLLHPLGTRPDETWARWYTRNFPRALAPLAILLLLSVRERIADYGVTEERYLGVVAGFWIVSWALVFIVRRSAGIRWIPASLAVISLLAAFGPWSAGAISRASQFHRLVVALQSHGLWRGDKAEPARAFFDLPAGEREQLESSLNYLITVHGTRFVAPLFAQVLDVTKIEKYKAAGAILEALNVRPGHNFASVSLHRDHATALPLAGYRQLWQVQFFRPIDSDPNHIKLGDLRVDLENGVLTFQSPSDHTPQALPFAPAVVNYRSDDEDRSLPAFTIDFTRGPHTYRIIFDEITFLQGPDRPSIRNCTFLLLEK